jgi:hypothetical protein
MFYRRFIEKYIFSIKIWLSLIVKNKKYRKQESKEKVTGWFGVFIFCFFFIVCLSGIPFRGGGKCPEEEHTTCSGGPTILVTSAVYGEREIILFHKIIIR